MTRTRTNLGELCLILASLVTNSIARDIDITCEGELIPKDHTLKFVYVTRWRTKDPPLHLVYRSVLGQCYVKVKRTTKYYTTTRVVNESLCNITKTVRIEHICTI